MDCIACACKDDPNERIRVRCVTPWIEAANAGAPVRLRSVELRRTRFPLAILRGCATRSPQGRSVVPLAGIEPALLAELDFESSASTSSATGAFAGLPERPALRSRRNIAGRLTGS